MNQRIHVKSCSPFEDLIGFSRAVRVGNHIAVSGTAPIGIDGQTHAPGNLYEQTKRCLEIIQSSIEDAGGSIQNVIRTRVYLTDAAKWEDAAHAHLEFFQEIRPASTFVEVSGFLNKDWLVEIEADCVLEEDGN